MNATKPFVLCLSFVTLATANLMGVDQPETFPHMRKIWEGQPASATRKTADARTDALFAQAEKNGGLAAEAFFRCHKYVDGWLAHRDPITGLIPRNLNKDKNLWNGRDCAADNYPFMVLTCALTDRRKFDGHMRDMLHTEIRLTSRIDRLCDSYLFSKRGFVTDTPKLDQIMFDNAEYVKDGLVPVTEWLGPSPWSERMIGIAEDIWKHAPIQTPFGRIPTFNFEVNGDLLQGCSRLYWFTGDRKFVDWAARLGDYYLLGTNHPTRDLKELRLSDHGCEVVNGLSELYVALRTVSPAKAEAYREPLHAIFDRILEVARNDDGLLYVSFNPRTGSHGDGLCDTWGYVYDGFYTLYLVDGTVAYRDAVRKALDNLKGKYVGAAWADRSADGFADSIEGALNLFNREPIDSTADWIDGQTRMMWAIQKPDGVIEGWHGDGNFARTSIMYALWKTQGVHAEPWREDLRVGAVRDGNRLLLSLAADQAWKGKLRFDQRRHKVNMHLPLDYPRINQFPEWFVAEPGGRYAVNGKKYKGEKLISGIPVQLKPGQEERIIVEPK